MRNISFSLTERQFIDGSKDVTRRLGWRFLKINDHLMGCRKCMGLKPGEKIVRLGEIEVVSVSQERLDLITPEEVRREGFPTMTPLEFVEMFCGHMRCKPDLVINRIEFRKVACESVPHPLESGGSDEADRGARDSAEDRRHDGRR